jgi:TRAP-type transport system small permease protein
MLFAGDGSPVYMVQAPKLLADRGTTNVSALTPFRIVKRLQANATPALLFARKAGEYSPLRCDQVRDAFMPGRAVLSVLQVALSALIGGGLLFALALNFANVILRYAFRAPIYWAEEVMIFTFVWCVFLGAAVVALRGDHLRVELFEWILPAGARRVLGVFIHLVAAVVMTFVAWRASSLLELVLRLQQKSIVGEIPMAVPYGAVFVGSVLLIIASLIRAAQLTFGIERTDTRS